MRDPTLCAKRTRRRAISRLLSSVLAAGGLLVALSSVSDAKPPTLPDLRKTVPIKKPSPAATPRSSRRVARPTPKPRSRVKTTVPSRAPVLSRHLGGARLNLGGVEIELTAIPAGEFIMGALATDSEADADEKPAHRVKVSRFEMGVTEVTVGQFQAYCRATGKEMPEQESWNSTAQHPVHNVTWADAVGYCEWATREMKRQGLPGSVRLPTEAEWEYAARGGATGVDGKPRYVYPWGDRTPSEGSGLANVVGKDDGFEYTAPVGRFKPTGYGLRDMAGNVWEWCLDRFDPRYYARSPGENPRPEEDGKSSFRVHRGGSWLDNPEGLRVSVRDYGGPSTRSYYGLGFRLARTLSP